MMKAILVGLGHNPDPAAQRAHDDADGRYRDVYFALKTVFAATGQA